MRIMIRTTQGQREAKEGTNIEMLGYLSLQSSLYEGALLQVVGIDLTCPLNIYKGQE